MAHFKKIIKTVALVSQFWEDTQLWEVVSSKLSALLYVLYML